MNQIAAVLDGLKQKISHGSTFIQRRYNEIGQAKFNLPEPVSAVSLAAFEAEFNQKLPSEYQTFLELHDGADLFILDDFGLVLHALDKVIEATNEAIEYEVIHEDFDHYWVIGEINEGYLLINREFAKTDDTPYMYWVFHELSTKEADPIGQNFGTFLEYSIISQGETFWELKDFIIQTDDYFVEETTEEKVSHPVTIWFVDAVRVEIEYPVSKNGSSFTISMYVGKFEQEKLAMRYNEGRGFEKVIQSVRDHLSYEQYHYSSIQVFQTEHSFWANEDSSGDPLVRNEKPQREGYRYDGFRAFADQLPRPLPGWE